MNYSKVAVDAHHGQAEDAGELVDGVDGHDKAAHEEAKGPRLHGVLNGQERQAEHEELVSYG